MTSGVKRSQKNARKSLLTSSQLLGSSLLRAVGSWSAFARARRQYYAAIITAVTHHATCALWRAMSRWRRLRVSLAWQQGAEAPGDAVHDTSTQTLPPVYEESVGAGQVAPSKAAVKAASPVDQSQPEEEEASASSAGPFRRTAEGVGAEQQGPAHELLQDTCARAVSSAGDVRGDRGGGAAAAGRSAGSPAGVCVRASMCVCVCLLTDWLLCSSSSGAICPRRRGRF